ncbi:TPA: hypothetical protein LU109_003605 [Enterobacter hormaechei subsp. xiangfangensis]|nr:hypothetical protein [Enterobacter hormaechei subsp. xiangfangensis]
MNSDPIIRELMASIVDNDYVFNSRIDDIVNSEPNMGIDHRRRFRQFIRERITHYAKVLKLSPAKILNAFEQTRIIYATQFYNEKNLPYLDPRRVMIFRDREHYKQVIGITGFRCPQCNQVSLHLPDRCENRKCGWRASSAFGTMGRGLRLILRESFLTYPQVYEIFMPIELEHLFENGALIDGETLPE